MDFVDGLARFNHANSIFVVVDSFTKYDHFLPLSHPFTSADVAKVLLNNVYHLHGLPTAIVSYHDHIFMSQLWRELFVLADVQLQMCSSYHPQSDGRTARLNQTMETFLCCFSNACLTNWSAWLPVCAATTCSPFEALYGYPPCHFGISALDSIDVLELSIWLQDCQVMTDLIH